MTATELPESRMAHDIAVAFQHLPEEQAVRATAEHLRKFWDPRMRSRLWECVEAGSEDLAPVVVAAVRHLGRPRQAGTG